ncbi:MAG: bifunctional DNA primase/polymerase [Chloroflexota bacterium]|nr:bifunctional DNA primase/polymerase [Chloroflexota bacterium]
MSASSREHAPAPLYDDALAAHEVGLCVVPPREDGSKAPAGTSWKRFQRERPSIDQLTTWYVSERRSGIGYVCGAVSGNLEMLEFEDRSTCEAFVALARELGLGDLVRRIATGYAEETPGGGFHLLYRCTTIGGNTKLASRPKRPEERRDPEDKIAVKIETRGEGGYVVAAPSNGRVHPSGGAYRLVRGGVDTIATITPDMRADLFALARSLDELPPSPCEPRTLRAEGDGTRPGDDFGARTEWRDILEPAGWQWVYRKGEINSWRRPGKERGVSASVFAESQLLYVFTTSTEFEAGRTYTKFGAFATLHHEGDYAAAAADLVTRGYGRPGNSGPTSPNRHSSSERPMSAAPFPKLDPAALHGLAGDVVRALDPHTEGDPVAVLTNYLAMVGNAIGGGPYAAVGEARHRVNIFATHVGGTAKARKGQAHTDTRAIVQRSDPTWAAERISGGLSSGEGLIYPIRDPIETMKKGELVIIDPGVSDKRLLLVEEEFSAVCKVASREGNTVSEQIRKAWDGRTLGTMTRNNPLRATSPHVSIIAHITKEELLRVFDSTDAANGFGNRFLWVYVRRSKILPEGGRLPDAEAVTLTRRTVDVLAFARKRGEVQRNEAARALWADVYPDLSEGRPGMLGALTARAEAHVLRLSLLYALLDQTPDITPAHLLAALALWDYCEASARYIFGDQTGDPIADRILAALRASGQMAQGEIIDLLGRHVNAGRLGKALEVLTAAGLARNEREETGGRPRTVWSAC